MTGPVIEGRAIRITSLDWVGYPTGSPELMGGPVWSTTSQRYEWVRRDRIRAYLNIEQPRSNMSIGTMEALAELPLGTRVYYQDHAYRRMAGGWWSMNDDANPIIRDRHFIGAVEAGQVSLEDTRALKIGALCQDTGTGGNYYVIQGEAVGGYVPTLVIRKNDGKITHRDHRARVSVLRAMVIDPQPALGPVLTALANEIKTKEDAITAVNEKVSEVQTAFIQFTQQQAGVAAFRRALKEFLDGEDGTIGLTSWEGVSIGDVMEPGSPRYHSLPVGSVVYHNSGSYWWKRDATEWIMRGGDATSSGMQRNTLVTIGNGVSVDPGTTI